MMNNFKPGARVGVLENGEIRKGTIKHAYYDYSIAIVAFEDGNVGKVHFSDLGLLPEEKAQEPKEPVEKSEITITPEEFKNVAMKVISEVTTKAGTPLVGIAFSIIIAKIHRALFIDEGEND